MPPLFKEGSDRKICRSARWSVFFSTCIYLMMAAAGHASQSTDDQTLQQIATEPRAAGEPCTVRQSDISSRENGEPAGECENWQHTQPPTDPRSGIPEAGYLSGQHIRSPLARAVYYKLKEDQRNQNDRHVYWYRVITTRFSEDLQGRFIQFEQDEEADEFLEHCREKSDQLFLQVFHSLARSLLNLFMTQTSINGLLNRGSMYIFSKPQFEKLLNISSYYKADSLLDLGAGDGMVTKQMSRYFSNTYATEMSGMMARRLTAMGFQVLGIDEWQQTGIQYDLISCLNLLDRCNTPMTLLSDMKKSLKPKTGRILVAVVIPFQPYVEFDSNTHEPTEHIHVRGSNFEEQVQHFSSIFAQSGFEIERFTRLPYLCEGDLRHSYFVLTDALFVLKPLDT